MWHKYVSVTHLEIYRYFISFYTKQNNKNLEKTNENLKCKFIDAWNIPGYDGWYAGGWTCELNAGFEFEFGEYGGGLAEYGGGGPAGGCELKPVFCWYGGGAGLLCGYGNADCVCVAVFGWFTVSECGTFQPTGCVLWLFVLLGNDGALGALGACDWCVCWWCTCWCTGWWLRWCEPP